MSEGLPSYTKDIRHLLDLLDMLPNRTEEPVSWEMFWEQVGPKDGGFYRDRLHEYDARLRNSPHDDPDFAEYAGNAASIVLRIFDVTDEAKAELWPILDTVVLWKPAYPGAAGRRWIDDVCATAWRVEVEAMAALPADKRRRWYREKRALIGS